MELIANMKGMNQDNPYGFPNPLHARRDGLVALGGDLTVPRLVEAYRRGIFPWSVDPISWWSPDPRGILELESFHVSRSLRRVLNQGRFQIHRDRDFVGVIEGCACAPRDGNWITADFIDAYERLHQAGYAHSVECWDEQGLAGGVYGVAVGGLFAGESMFHRVTNASKVALHALVQHLKAKGFQLLDIQMVTPTTEALGATQISRADYLKRLEQVVDLPCIF